MARSAFAVLWQRQARKFQIEIEKKTGKSLRVRTDMQTYCASARVSDCKQPPDGEMVPIVNCEATSSHQGSLLHVAGIAWVIWVWPGSLA